jgi:hypothetical protein
MCSWMDDLSILHRKFLYTILRVHKFAPQYELLFAGLLSI